MVWVQLSVGDELLWFGCHLTTPRTAKSDTRGFYNFTGMLRGECQSMGDASTLKASRHRSRRAPRHAF